MEQFVKAFIALVLAAILAFTALTIARALGVEAQLTGHPPKEGCPVDARDLPVKE